METLQTLRGPMGLTFKECSDRLESTRHEKRSARRARKIKRVRDEMSDIRLIWRNHFAGA